MTGDMLLAAKTTKDGRAWSARLLFAASASAILSIIVSTAATALDLLHTAPRTNYLGEPFHSGNPQVPNTVSMLLHAQNSPPARAGFFFQMLAAILIVASRYPWDLQNVYTNEVALPIFGGGGPSWSSCRMIASIVALTVSVCDPMSANDVSLTSTPPELLLFIVHSLGSSFGVLGYFAAEMHVLRRGAPSMFAPGERRVRGTQLVLAMVALPVFILGMGACWYSGLPCFDVYRVPTWEEVAVLAKDPLKADLAAAAADAARHHQVLLYDTSSGGCLAIGTACLFAETLVVLLISCNTMTIWYFCPERRLCNLDGDGSSGAPRYDAMACLTARHPHEHGGLDHRAERQCC